FFFFSSRRRHTRSLRDWSSDVCSSDLRGTDGAAPGEAIDRVGELAILLERDAELAQRFAHPPAQRPAGVARQAEQGGSARLPQRSEERRVGKEWRTKWAAYH